MSQVNTQSANVTMLYRYQLVPLEARRISLNGNYVNIAIVYTQVIGLYIRVNNML